MADTVIEKPANEVDIESDDLRLMEEAGKKHDDKKMEKDEPEKKEDIEEKEEDKPEVEELVDEEEELEIKPEEELVEDKLLDEIPNYRGIDFKKIKAKFPEFSKTNEYRELKNSFYREAKFSEIFPTLEDASEALENHETFVKLNDEIINKGSISGLLTAIKEANPESLKKVSESFLDSLSKIEPSLYASTISPVVKRLVRQIYADGIKHRNRNPESDEAKALIASARNLAMWAFDDPDIVEKQDDLPKRNTELEDKERELTEREQKIATERYESALRLAKTNLDRHLDKQILDGLNIENEFLRDTLLEKVKEEIEKQISSDDSHMRRMQQHWRRAEQEGYSNKAISRIINAYLERARPIIPIVRNRLKNAALGKRAREEENDNVKMVRGRSGKAPSNEGKINMKLVDPKKIDYSQTSDEDIFSGKVKMKQ